MKKQIKENIIPVGALAIGGICLLTGNCQIGLAVLAPAAVYQGVAVVKEVVANKESKVTEE